MSPSSPTCAPGPPHTVRPVLVCMGLLLGALPTTARAGETCTDWGEPVLLAEIDSTAINESSGLAASRLRPGHWFTHNDAGGSADLFAFTEDGEHVETHAVQGAAFRDWEALGDGPCPPDVAAEHCLYIGDIGDNSRTRGDVFVYVAPEPASGEDAVVEAIWRLGWPEGAEDSEALLVHPCTGRVYLITKHNGGRDASVWRLPQDPVLDIDPAPLEWVATLPQPWLGNSGQVTGGDWSDSGNQLVVRTYNGAWLWDTDPADPDAHWATAPTEIPLDTTGQGESISFAAAGSIVATAEGVPMRVVTTPCAATLDAPDCPDEEPDDTGPTEHGDTAQDQETTEDSNPDDSNDPDGSTRPPGAAAQGGSDGCGGGKQALVFLPMVPIFLARRARRTRPALEAQESSPVRR